MMNDDIFHKACKNGIYTKEWGIIDAWGIDDEDEIILADLKNNRLILLYDSSLSGLTYQGACFSSGYGKTWALTREELEEHKEERNHEGV